MKAVVYGFPYRLLLALALSLASAWAGADQAPVMLLKIDGAIGPASADYVTRGIQQAATEGAQLVVLQMDTPGGLDTSMRQIIKAILASPIPVAGYVSPSGARAASAGTYILYASHIAAMAPGTNLGAATPVAIGAPSFPGDPKPSSRPGESDEKQSDPGKAEAGKKSAERSPEKPEVAPAAGSKDPMAKKAVSDAAAYIRGLAQMRGRNAEWAEQAVREAVSLSAKEALEQRVIDYIADDVANLLKQVDGKKITTVGAQKTLATEGAAQMIYEPDWRAKTLAVITDPSIAIILMMIGVYGLFFEFSNPGFVAPGVIGAICLLLALYAFQLLPVSYAGLLLIALGLAFMVAEAFVPSFGALGIGGITAFVIGALILIDTELPGFGVPLALIVPVAIVSAVFLATVGGMALRARRRPVVSGREQLLGSMGEVLEASGNEGWAWVHGERWRVTSTAPLTAGQQVRVTRMDGLLLTVSPAEKGTKP